MKLLIFVAFGMKQEKWVDEERQTVDQRNIECPELLKRQLWVRLRSAMREEMSVFRLRMLTPFGVQY